MTEYLDERQAAQVARRLHHAGASEIVVYDWGEGHHRVYWREAGDFSLHSIERVAAAVERGYLKVDQEAQPR